jgi:hypothetical protein
VYELGQPSGGALVGVVGQGLESEAVAARDPCQLVIVGPREADVVVRLTGGKAHRSELSGLVEFDGLSPALPPRL